MNILTYRETLSSDDLSYKCTNTLKTLGRAEQCSAKVQRNVDKARLINRRTYLRTEKRCEDVTYRERLGRETITSTNVAINGKKTITEDQRIV